MGSPALAQIRWSQAAEAASHHAPGQVPLAEVLSLSALYVHDFDTAVAQIREAIHREPLNPVHRLRKALLLARFGNLDAATEVLDRLKETVPDLPLIDYLRALFGLRAGATDKARGITGSIETAHPSFVYAKFLRAESQIIASSKARTAEKYLMTLPSGKAFEGLWADLLVKLVLFHPHEGPELAKKYADKKVPKDSPARAAVETAIIWAEASATELAASIAQQPVGSPGEALLLECLADRLRSEKPEVAIGRLTELQRNHPDRPSLRRIFSEFLTRMATDLSGSGRHEEALRLVDRCLRDQPQDPVHYQNRAAIFTLLRESGPYHDAWAALNAHQYRLALLGAFDAASIRRIATTHRLFSQQARGNTSAARRFTIGVFRVVEDDDGRQPYVATDVDQIAADPDLLRQWIHHTRAELVFRHALLGSDARAVLLDPKDRDEAAARAGSLASLGGSLGVLVPQEGAALAEALGQRWGAMAASVRTRYEIATQAKAAEGDPSAATEASGEEQPKEKAEDKIELNVRTREIDALKVEHLGTLADACLVCLQWWPEADQFWIAEELIAFTQAEIAFFDNEVLSAILKRHDTPHALQILAHQVRKVAGEKADVTEEHRKHAVENCIARLLRGMALTWYHAHTGDTESAVKDAAARAMTFIDRARAFNPADADIELTSAELLSLGEYYEECRHSLDRFRRLASPDDQKSIERANKLEETLRTRRKEGKIGTKRSRSEDLDSAVQGSEFRIRELERDLDRSPMVWRLYDELVRELAINGRFDSAVDWADRSIAQCLTRADQMNARALAIAARGMRALAETNPRAARLFAVGAHEPARKALAAVESGKMNYSLLYLLGRSELAVGLTEEARESFRRAELCCERQLHRSVLRSLAQNTDIAYIAVARTSVNDALQEGTADEALEAAAAVFARLEHPEAWLIDFARTYYNLAVMRAGAPEGPPPTVSTSAEWQDRLLEALNQPSDAARALALAQLAGAVHPPSANAAEVLVERAKALKLRIGLAELLSRAGALLAEKKFAATLALLDGGNAAGSEPRLLRIRALAMLGERRFEEADRAVEEIGDRGGSEVREFVEMYPSLALRQKLRMAQEWLREGKGDDADRALRDAVASAPKDQAELAYCRAFALTLQAYELRKSGQSKAAKDRFLAALAVIEPHLGTSQGEDHRHLSELYDRLESEVEHASR